jgi:L-ascorbate metabolism protein UlaG (beta-lactamase superfamily)
VRHLLLPLGLIAPFVARAARGLPRSLGAGTATLRHASAMSPHARAGRFVNTEPAAPIDRGAILPSVWGKITAPGSPGRPPGPIPVVPGVPEGPAGSLAVTWFGHASALLEIDGQRVLTDPMWSERASPSPAIGPKRMHPVPAVLERVPAPDAIVISHDHYDHLDVASVETLRDSTVAPFVVPLGIGAHLRSWGVPDARIVELDWGGSTRVGKLTITCAEARHFSGRGLARDTTLWSSWAVAGPAHRVYFGGDTGYTAAFARAGAELGPFDLTLLPVGAYSQLWPDIHMNPEEAVAAHRDLRGGMLVPIHWATFDLGFHGWAEPVTRLVAAAADPAKPVRIAIPRPGQRIDVTAPDGAHSENVAADEWWNGLT